MTEGAQWNKIYCMLSPSRNYNGWYQRVKCKTVNPAWAVHYEYKCLWIISQNIFLFFCTIFTEYYPKLRMSPNIMKHINAVSFSAFCSLITCMYSRYFRYFETCLLSLDSSQQGVTGNMGDDELTCNKVTQLESNRECHCWLTRTLARFCQAVNTI